VSASSASDGIGAIVVTDCVYEPAGHSVPIVQKKLPPTMASARLRNTVATPRSLTDRQYWDVALNLTSPLSVSTVLRCVPMCRAGAAAPGPALRRSGSPPRGVQLHPHRGHHARDPGDRVGAQVGEGGRPDPLTRHDHRIT
jgi:hypothetical protein